MSNFATYPSATFWTVESGDVELPVGAISLWSLLNGGIPANWAECDGTANAPGPDLRNLFVVGRGTKTVDTTGGAATHTHGDALSHSGGAVDAHGVTQPNSHTDVLNHVHLENQNSATTGSLVGWAARDTSTSTSSATGYSTANPTSGGVAAQVHSGAAVAAHVFTQPSAPPAHAATNHEPAWYAMIYIQRMS